MLIKVFTSIVDGWDSLNPPPDETDFTVNLYRLPRGYTAQTDSRGYRYIRCPNGAVVYDLDQSVRPDAGARQILLLANAGAETSSAA